MKSIRLGYILPAVLSAALLISEVHALAGFTNSQVPANGSTTTGSMATQRDGSHDFDFLIGDWKAQGYPDDVLEGIFHHNAQAFFESLKP